MAKRNNKNERRIKALKNLKKWLEYDKGRGVDTARIEEQIKTLEGRIKEIRTY